VVFFFVFFFVGFCFFSLFSVFLLFWVFFLLSRWLVFSFGVCFVFFCVPPPMLALNMLLGGIACYVSDGLFLFRAVADPLLPRMSAF